MLHGSIIYYCTYNFTSHIKNVVFHFSHPFWQRMEGQLPPDPSQWIPPIHAGNSSTPFGTFDRNDWALHTALCLCKASKQGMHSPLFAILLAKDGR
jgi:hypothetical protein